MKTVIGASLLICSILLVGCSNNKETNEVPKKSKIEKISKNEVSDKTTSSENNSSKTIQTETQPNKTTSSEINAAKTTQTETQRDFDYNAIANNDYSSAAGVWKNGVGSSYIINNDGTGTAMSAYGDNQPFTIKTNNNNSLMTVPNMTEAEKKLSRSGAAVHFIKIGENHWTIEKAESDKTKPRITIEQGDLSSSEQILYREN